MNSSALFDKICSTTFSDLTVSAVSSAKQLFLDGVAVGIAGARTEEAIAILTEHFCRNGGLTEATLLGQGRRTSLYGAAMVNGAAMHVLDFEPMWSPSNHAISTMLPAILALSETTATTGKGILAALVKGCEIQGWLREASRQYEPRHITFHPPGVVGPVGAAVAAGHILGLQADTLAHAVGIAGSRAGSLSANIGTMTKCAHCGYAAADGLEAALLAERGFTANPQILGANQGFVKAFFPNEFHFEDLMRFGAPFRLVEPGYALKLFPSQFGTHFAIAAALDVRSRLPPGDPIDGITLIVPDMPYVNRPTPANGLDGKFSFQFTAAVALLDGEVTALSFTDERLADPALQDLLQRIRLVVDPDIPAQFEKMRVEVHATLQSGVAIACQRDRLDGMWGNPVSDDTFLRKIRNCLSLAVRPSDIESIIALTTDLDLLQPADVAELIRLLGCFDIDTVTTQIHPRKLEHV